MVLADVGREVAVVGLLLAGAFKVGLVEGATGLPLAGERVTGVLAAKLTIGLVVVAAFDAVVE